MFVYQANQHELNFVLLACSACSQLFAATCS